MSSTPTRTDRRRIKARSPMNEEILKRLDLLASKLNVTAEHLWQACLRQSRIEGYTDTFILILALVAIWADVKWGRWLYRQKDESPIWMAVVIVGLVAIPTALVC